MMEQRWAISIIIIIFSLTPCSHGEYITLICYTQSISINTITTAADGYTERRLSSNVCSWVPRAMKLMNDGELNTASPGTRTQQRGSVDEMLLYTPALQKITSLARSVTLDPHLSSIFQSIFSSTHIVFFFLKRDTDSFFLTLAANRQYFLPILYCYPCAS